MNASRRLIRVLSAATALGLGAVTLTACGGDADKADGKVKVITALYPLQYLAQQIGREHVAVESLTKPGAEPHDLELSPQQTGALSEADLVVHLKGLQPAVDEGIEQAEAKHVADAASYTTLEKHGSTLHGEKDGHGEEHAHGEKDGHDHSVSSGGQGGDPHIWLDPVRYAQVAKGVGKELAKADPAHKADYKRNTRDLTERLDALDQDFKKGLKKRKTDTFITTHAAFGYLAERYGLHEEAVAGIDPESEPSGARMKELHKAAKKGKADTVFFEEGAGDKTAKTLADDLNLRTGVLSTLESVRNPERQNYLSVMEQNLMALRVALGVV